MNLWQSWKKRFKKDGEWCAAKEIDDIWLLKQEMEPINSKDMRRWGLLLLLFLSVYCVQYSFAAYMERGRSAAEVNRVKLTTEEGNPGIRAVILRAEIIPTPTSVPSAHASTIVETADGLLVAWFGGSYERHAHRSCLPRFPIITQARMPLRLKRPAADRLQPSHLRQKQTCCGRIVWRQAMGENDWSGRATLGWVQLSGYNTG